MISQAPIDGILITDSVSPPSRDTPLGATLHVISVAGLLAEAIRQCHFGGPSTIS
jgi:phosphoribosylpyrophosphate synthetase